jgi:phospholipid transport system transporter-binding protein
MTSTRPAFQAGGDGQVRVAGDLTFSSVAALLAESRRALPGNGTVTVDLSGVAGVDSAGLALLIEWLRESRANGRELHFTGLPERLRAIAGLAGVEDLLGQDSQSTSS